MISLFEPNLNTILDRVSHRDILEYYTGTKLNKSIKSPFRTDRYPTITFKQVNDRVIWKDWSTGESGDGITWVMKLYNISFNEAITTIYRAFVKNLDIIPTKQEKLFIEPKIGLKKDFIIDTQNFTYQDYLFWKCFGISINTLKKYNVFSINNFYIEGKTEYVNFYSYNNIIYGYRFDYEEDYRWKLYMPYKARNRFLYNGSSSIIEGFDQLPWLGELLIITKSMKDVMLLSEYGYNSISLQGEANILTNDSYDNLSSRFNRIISLYDNDDAGIIGATRLKDLYGIEDIYIPKYTNQKDISDTYRYLGKDYVRGLLNNLLKDVN